MFESIQTLLNGEEVLAKVWDFFLFTKRTFTSDEDITIPVDKSLILHSPKIDGELAIDGEGYIL